MTGNAVISRTSAQVFVSVSTVLKIVPGLCRMSRLRSSLPVRKSRVLCTTRAIPTWLMPIEMVAPAMQKNISAHNNPSDRRISATWPVPNVASITRPTTIVATALMPDPTPCMMTCHVTAPGYANSMLLATRLPPSHVSGRRLRSVVGGWSGTNHRQAIPRLSGFGCDSDGCTVIIINSNSFATNGILGSFTC